MIERSWIKREVAMLGTEYDCVIAKAIGRTQRKVMRFGHEPGIAARRQTRGKSEPMFWSMVEIAMRGRYSGAEFARRTGKQVDDVQARRRPLTTTRSSASKAGAAMKTYAAVSADVFPAAVSHYKTQTGAAHDR